MKKILLATLALGSASNALGMNFQFSEGVSLDADVQLKYEAAWRIGQADSKLVSNINADDGNRSFDAGDMVNDKYSVITDIDFKYHNVGAFLRPRAFYDKVYDQSNANDSPSTNNNMDFYGGSLSKSNHFSQKTKDRHRDTVELLDAYAYGAFDLGGHLFDARVGQQTVAWGESLYNQTGISGAQSPLDATAANLPGTAVKEIILPVQQAFGQLSLTDNLTVAAYYQWEWEKTRLNEQGSYFSDSDLIDEAGENALINGLSQQYGIAINKTQSKDAKDSGQWGVSAHYIVEDWNDTDFGVYFINYHDKTPMVIGERSGGTYANAVSNLPTANSGFFTPPFVLGFAPDNGWGNLPIGLPGNAVFPGSPAGYYGLGLVAPASAAGLNGADLSSYHLEYAENIKLFGLSAGTTLGENGSTSVTGEMSYRQDVPLQVVDAGNVFGFSYVRGDVVQLQTSVIEVLGVSPVWDALTLTGEIAVNQASNYGGNELYNNKSSWGGTVVAAADYFQVMPGLDLTPSVTYKFNPSGTSSLAGSFTQDEDSVELALSALYQSEYKARLFYVDYLHSASNSVLADRDMVGVRLEYTF